MVAMPEAAFTGISSFSEYDGMGLAELVRRKQATPHELLGCAMANAEAVNPRINCLAHTHYEEARAQIAAGLPAGAFQGVPFIIKDLGVEPPAR